MHHYHADRYRRRIRRLFLGKMIGWYEPGATSSFIGSIVGAMLLLLLYRLIAPKRP